MPLQRCRKLCFTPENTFMHEVKMCTMSQITKKGTDTVFFHMTNSKRQCHCIERVGHGHRARRTQLSFWKKRLLMMKRMMMG